MRPIVRNPYIAGKAIRDSRLFVGRNDVIQLVERSLDSPEQNAVVLFGQRRIGKTSILLQLQSRLRSDRFHPVYFDLMDRARKSLPSITSELATVIRSSLSLTEPAPDDDAPDELLDTLPYMYRTLPADVRLTFLFDEFDVLDIAAEEELPSDAAARSFFPYLRQLMTEHPKLAFIFVVGRKAGDLSIDVKATFKGARHHRISVLDPVDATKLIELGDREGTLRFTDDAKARILALTRGHPYFTQLCCQVLFDRAHAAISAKAELVTREAVDSAVPAVVDAGENVFEWIWDGLPPAERVVFAAIASGTREGVVISEDDLTQVIQRHGIRILIRELELAPTTLIEWEMLTKADGGYQFFVELLRRWVADRKPLPLVKNEIDRINPLADQYYQLGQTFYRSNDFAEAATHLQAALKVNPNHLNARLLLGEALGLLNRTTEAVDHYREAYRYDEDATRYHLVRGLLSLAEEVTAAKNGTNAIALYDEVLAISPHEIVAQDRRRDLLVSRGDGHLLRGDLGAALKDFQLAGADDRIRAVENSYQQQRVESLSSELMHAMEEERWVDAGQLCQELLRLRPNEPRWKAMLAAIDSAAYLARQYSEALGLMQQGKLDEAQSLLLSVVARTPDYKDAAETLAEIVARRRRASAGASAGLGHAATQLISPGGWVKSTNEVTTSRAAESATVADEDVGSRSLGLRTLRVWIVATASVATVGICAVALAALLLMWWTSSSVTTMGIGSRWIYAVESDGVRVWRINDGALVRLLDRKVAVSPSIILDEEGRSAIAIDGSHLLRADLDVGSGSATYSAIGLPINARSLAISADGATLAASDNLNTVVVLRLPSLVEQCEVRDSSTKQD